MIAQDETVLRSDVVQSDSDQSDEAILVAYVETKDTRLFDRLVQRYERELFEYLRNYAGDSAIAQDAVQGTWLQVHLKCHTFAPGRKFRPWLYTIGINQAIDLLRSQRRHRMVSLDQPFGGSLARETLVSQLPCSKDDPRRRAQRWETRAEVRNAVHRLPSHLRQLVGLVFFDGLKYREAAERLSIPEGTAKSRMHLAFRQLQLGLGQLAS